MPLLFLDGSIPDPVAGTISSDAAAVRKDLALIVLHDSGMGYGGTKDPKMIQLMYDQNKSGFGPNLITTLVGLANRIIILGVDRPTVISLGGVNGLGQTSVEQSGTIRIVYDTTQCGGRGTHVLGANNQRIENPSYVILYHELVHAKHIALGTVTSDPERLAREEENECRMEHNLRLRDVNSSAGGCGAP